MNNNYLTANRGDYANDSELLEVLHNGTYKEKEHVLLNMALGGGNSEKVLDLFLSYTKEPEMETVAYMCIDKFLENYRQYPLRKVLPILISGLSSPKEIIRNHCLSGLDNLVAPRRQKSEKLSFGSFQVVFKYDYLQPYLRSDSPEDIIIALLYLFHNPHQNEELFRILDEQLARNIPAVTCIIGVIVDTKLADVIDLINLIGGLALNTYTRARVIGLRSRASWAYDRFDSIRELAREHMKVMVSETRENSPSR